MSESHALVLRSVLDALPNPIIVIAGDNRVTFANSAAEDFFQTSSAHLCKLEFAELVPFSSPILQSVELVRNQQGTVQEYSVAIGTPKVGGERIVDIQTSPSTDESRFVVMMVLRRSVAHKLDLQLSHQGAARSVAGMASMLAHEIKNPLSGIRGAAQLLETSLPDSDRMLTRLICDETDRIRDLVDQMEVFSDERPVDRKPVNIHVVLDRVKQLIAYSPDIPLVFREDFDPSLPDVFGNHDQLVQVFLNLGKNALEAIQATGEQGEIALTTAFRPGVKLAVPGSTERVSLPLEVCVHDTGAGVAPEIRDHIFEPFITNKLNGRGLGLPLVAKIIRDHGGVVECLPRDRGTTFRVLLPLIRDRQPNPQTMDRQQ
jgi:two-component system, NtrC family, nitrogen regulation sensor histidine kinase GlnL